MIIAVIVNDTSVIKFLKEQHSYEHLDNQALMMNQGHSQCYFSQTSQGLVVEAQFDSIANGHVQSDDNGDDDDVLGREGQCFLYAIAAAAVVATTPGKYLHFVE